MEGRGRGDSGEKGEEGGREGGREGRKEGGREGGKEGGREGGREGVFVHTISDHVYISKLCIMHTLSNAVRGSMCACSAHIGIKYTLTTATIFRVVDKEWEQVP